MTVGGTYERQLFAAVDAVSILSPTSYTWLGTLSDPLPAHVVRKLSALSARAYLRWSLANRLYADFYCAAGRARTSLSPVSSLGDAAPFVHELSDANTGGGCWDEGWELGPAVAGGARCTKNGLTLEVRPHELQRRSGAAPAERRVAIRYPKELRGLYPGFYMALGDAGFPERGHAIVRVYFHLAASAAVPLVAAATAALNRAAVAFRLKVANKPTAFTRADAGVLYLVKSSYADCGALIAAIYEAVASKLRPETPAFTKVLAPGLGFAEDPGDHHQSFGQHRCELLAEGLIRAAEHGAGSAPARVQVVANVFRESGIDPERPYLSAGVIEHAQVAVS